MSTGMLLLVFGAGLLCSALFSMIEAAVISQDRRRLAHLADSGSRAARQMQKMLGSIDRLLATILLFNNIANVTCATAATVLVTRMSGGGAGTAFLASLGVAFLILVLSEIAPKIVGVRHSKTISLMCAAPLRGLLALALPVTAVANFLARATLGIFGVRQAPGLHEAMTVSELKSAVRESKRLVAGKDIESGRHYSMVEQLLSLAETPVEKLMTPRSQICALNLKDERGVREQILQADHTKMPVHDGALDDAMGFISVLDALKHAAGDGQLDEQFVNDNMLPKLFLPAAADALQQFEHMRKEGSSMALVVDGSGRVAGLVTHSNFSAAVIGEIGEENDAPVMPDPDGCFMAPGDFPLIKLGETLPDRHLSIPETTASTINGLILESRGGKLPAKGETLEIGNITLEIREIGEQSVRKAFIIPPPPAPPPQNEA